MLPQCARNEVSRSWADASMTASARPAVPSAAKKASPDHWPFLLGELAGAHIRGRWIAPAYGSSAHETDGAHGVGSARGAHGQTIEEPPVALRR